MGNGDDHNEKTNIHPDDAESADREKRLMKVAAAMFAGAFVLFLIVLMTGHQGTILCGLPLALIVGVASLIVLAVTQKSMKARIAISVGAVLLVIGGLVFLLVLIMAAGFGSVR